VYQGHLYTEEGDLPLVQSTILKTLPSSANKNIYFISDKDKHMVD
jgi:hypothetical protein